MPRSMMRQLGKYQLMKSIATGGMAEIFVAKQSGIEGFEKLVVVKLLQPEMARNQDAVDMFLNEARLAARLSHPNVVQIFDLGAAGDDFYIAMEYIHGVDLLTFAKAFKKQKKILSLEQILSIVCYALEGLHYAHTQVDQRGAPLDIVHCDVSPHNILVSFEGVVKVVDFGIAKVVSKLGKTESSLVSGKLSYMSPEQARGMPLDGRTDLFSLGIVLWELTAGRRLYPRKAPAEIMRLLTTTDIPSPRHINALFPVELEPIVLRAVARDPAKRFQSAFEMHQALVAFMKTKGMTQSSMELSATMKDLFADRITSVKRIEQAQQAGAGLEDLLFDDLGIDDGSPAPGSGEDPEAAAPVEITEKPRFATGVSTTSITSQPPPRPRALWKPILLVLVLAGAGVAAWLHQERLIGFAKGLFGDEQVVADKLTGTVRLETEPQGAAVLIDGKDRCQAPCVLAQLEVGVEHSFEASLDGYEPSTEVLRLKKAGEVKVLIIRLSKIGKRLYGTLLVSTEPAGAKVEIDGRSALGVSPMTIKRVVAGRKHRLKASLPGRRPWLTSFSLQPNQKLQLSGVLPPSLGQGKASFSIDSTPKADVYIDDKKVGRTPLKGLIVKAGPLMVDLRLPGLGLTESLIVQAKEGKAVSERVTFPKGELDAQSSPKADVIVDGKRIGTTPIKHKLPPGNHQITFQNFSQKLRAERVVTIKPRQTTKVVVDLLK